MDNETYRKSLGFAIQKWVDDMNETSDWRYSMPDQVKEECVAVMTNAAFNALIKLNGATEIPSVVGKSGIDSRVSEGC